MFGLKILSIMPCLVAIVSLLCFVKAKIDILCANSVL